MPRTQRLGLLVALALAACEPIQEAEDDDESPRVYTEADGFNGDYDGTWVGGQSDRDAGILTGSIELTISNHTTVTGDLAPISGSVRAVSGTVNGSGAITASAAAGINGCVVTFNGQVTTSPGAGTVNATASGSYVLVPSSTCNTNTGSWTVTRK